MTNKSGTTIARHEKECLEFAEFERLNYFFGQLLGPGDFQLEQRFFREKLKLHNRCLHGYGTVCGLEVEPVPIPHHCPSPEDQYEKERLTELEKLEAEKQAAHETGEQRAADEARSEELRRDLKQFYKKHCLEEPKTLIRIMPGLALDCDGNELALRRSRVVDPLQWLSAQDYKRVQQGADTLYVAICYCEQPSDSARVVIPDVCGSTAECHHTRINECVKVSVTVDPPKEDSRCESCCTCCPQPCLLLAKIECFHPGLPLFRHNIHNGMRRHLDSSYHPTVITGVSWRNGHYYTQREARRLMGTREEEYRLRGLEIHFSRPVRAATIHPGVMDTWVIEGGGGRKANIYNKTGEFVDKPHDGTVRKIVYHDTSGETLQPGDRVLVTLRTEFILDECCRPVDGMNVGGRVPTLPKFAKEFHLHDRASECHTPPWGYGHWTSGIGAPCGVFQGWFFIRSNDQEYERHGGEEIR